jgi:hypothetical protein
MGAGMMFHKCKPCLGVGFVEQSKPIPIEDVETPSEEIVLRRTRKRKVKPDEAVCHAES